MVKKNFLWRAYSFYYHGFKHMTVGKTLWTIIIIKLIIMFGILKFFFFPNILKRDFKTNEERSKHVIEQLTYPNNTIYD